MSQFRGDSKSFFVFNVTPQKSVTSRTLSRGLNPFLAVLGWIPVFGILMQSGLRLLLITLQQDTWILARFAALLTGPWLVVSSKSFIIVANLRANKLLYFYITSNLILGQIWMHSRLWSELCDSFSLFTFMVWPCQWVWLYGHNVFSKFCASFNLKFRLLTRSL